ncbi:MAG: hypothetical protein U0T73_08625 [Chitinophagales bacterium]
MHNIHLKISGMLMVLSSMLFAAPPSAQQDLHEVEKIRNYYQIKGYFETDIESNYYAGVTEVKPYLKQNVKLVYSKDAVYYGVNEVEVFAMHNAMVQVNKPSHEIYVQQWTPDADRNPYSFSWMDSLLKSKKLTLKVTDLQNGKAMMVMYSSATTNTYKIWYEKATGKIEQLEMQMPTQFSSQNGKPIQYSRMQLIYRNAVKHEGTFPFSRYDSKKYVNVNGKKASLTASSKGYKLNDYLNLNVNSK